MILKTKISEFIETESIKSNTSWSSWILKNIPEFMSTREKSELIDFLYKNNLYKNKVDNGIDEMTLGKLKTISNIIFHTYNVNPGDRDYFCDELFNKSLNMGLDLSNVKYYNVVSNLITVNHLRNSIAHSDSFNTFWLKELFEQIKHLNNKNNLKQRFWIVKNLNKDKTIKTFIMKHKIFNNLNILKSNYESGEYTNDKSKTKHIESLIKFKNELHSDLFDSVEIGYYIEIENLASGQITCLDFDILLKLNWWFDKMN